MTVRIGEPDRTWYRSDRMMHVNDQWFFTTREMTQEGPFTSKNEAEMELNLYIRHVNDQFYRKSG